MDQQKGSDSCPTQFHRISKFGPKESSGPTAPEDSSDLEDPDNALSHLQVTTFSTPVSSPPIRVYRTNDGETITEEQPLIGGVACPFDSREQLELYGIDLRFAEYNHHTGHWERCLFSEEVRICCSSSWRKANSRIASLPFHHGPSLIGGCGSLEVKLSGRHLPSACT